MECSTAEDVLCLARLLQKCKDFKVVQYTWKSKDKIFIHSTDFQLTQLHLTLEDDMTDGCRALGEQLKRFAKHNIIILAKVAQILHLKIIELLFHYNHIDQVSSEGNPCKSKGSSRHRQRLPSTGEDTKTMSNEHAC